MGIQNPKVGLVNVGAEDTKGGDLQKEAYALLQKAPINFTGNVEARDIPAGEVDVAVADGFTGNVVLKLTEGLGSMFSKKIKEMFLSGATGKLAAVLMMNKLKDFKKAMDYTEYGGAPLLGAALPVIKAHGSSNAYAFKNAIRQARDFVAGGVNGKSRRLCSSWRRSPPQTKNNNPADPMSGAAVRFARTGRSKKFRIDPFLKGSRESKEQSSLAGAQPSVLPKLSTAALLTSEGCAALKNNPKTVIRRLLRRPVLNHLEPPARWLRNRRTGKEGQALKDFVHKEDLAELQEKIGYTFKREAYLEQR